MSIWLRRAYEEPTRNDGFRVLVDRVWPRGVSKDEIQVDAWKKELAPSTELRKWFNHDPEKWEEFKRRYFRELEENEDSWKNLYEKLRDGRITLVYGSKDEEHNNALVLKQFLEEKQESE